MIIRSMFIDVNIKPAYWRSQLTANRITNLIVNLSQLDLYFDTFNLILFFKD